MQRSILVNVIIWAMGLGMLCLSAPTRAATPAYVWLEGESPTAANYHAAPDTSGHPEWLSGGKWLLVAVDANALNTVPGDGLSLAYAFDQPRQDKCQVWARIGFESARTPFDWRIDDGPWQHIDSQNLSTDLMELSFFCEVCWLQLGDTDISAGKHQLEIHVPKTKDAKGEPQRLLFGLDALCITPGPFHPLSKFKPNEDPRTDADVAVAGHVFNLPPAPAGGGRGAVALKGVWEITRDDEGIPAPVDEPIKELPHEPRWSAIAVPGDKANARPDLTMAHRVWYRTKVNVPAEYAGRSFYVEFPQNNLNTTVFVNGIYCGFGPYPFARFTIDVTKAIKPDGDNELAVGIRDAWYGYYRDPANPAAMRHSFALPPAFLGNGFQDLVYPVWNHRQSGILETPTFVAAGGPVYAADVFDKASVTDKQLAVDVDVLNPSAADASGEVVCQAVDAKTGQVAKSLTAKPFTVAAGQHQVVQLADAWTNAKLWWPDADPALYTLRTTVILAGKPADVSDTTFGFRQWTWEGHDFKLNGVVWHGWADQFSAPNLDAWLNFYRHNNQRFFRFWAPNRFYGMEDEAALNWFDRNGIVIRRTGVFDGEAMGYHSNHLDELTKNAMATECAQILGERNHPSIMIWSLENEISFINAFNANWIDAWEKCTAELWQKIHTTIDPTRPVMVDGGGAGKANLLPVAGEHYITGDPSLYPKVAYETNAKGAQPDGGGRRRWVWDQQRPRFVGEDFFYQGNHPELAALGGDAAFGGKASTLRACGLMWQILQQGYRWANYGAWNLWIDQACADSSQYCYYAPRAALVKEWDWTFAAGSATHRTVGIFNDSHSDDPLHFAWTFNLNGQQVAGEAKDYQVPAGTRQTVDLAIAVPAVDRRAEGELTLSLTVAGQEVFHDTKAVSVLKPQLSSKDAVAAGGVLIYDPAGQLGAFLKNSGVPFAPVADLKSLPESGKVLIVGKDAIDARQATSSQLAAYAASGRVVIVLQQETPLEYQAIPAEMEPGRNQGQVGFPEDLDDPAMKNLKEKDFFTWGVDGDLYRNAYGKPTRGGRSLLQCGAMLGNTALVEVPAGKGMMVLSQLLVEQKIAECPAAQQLLLNLVEFGLSYKQTFRDVTVVAADAPELAKAIDGMGLRYTNGADPLDALAKPGTIAVIAATPANLAKLADNLPKVQAFTDAGGWIIFNGLTPDGLASYNKIVGVEHLIRKFKRERVTFAPVHDPLLAGITTSDVVMYSSRRIFGFQEGNYVVSDEFSYVVDYDEVAPFATSTFFAFDNIVGGFVNADGWPLIINFPINPDGSPSDVPMTFPRKEAFTELTWTGNLNYWPQTKLNLIFDGNAATKIAYEVEPTGSPQTLKIDPPRAASQVTLQIAGWQEIPDRKPLIGIDNIHLRVQRTPEFLEKVKPMLNVGGLVRYPQGRGGVVLCNLLFKNNEEVPVNVVKKQNLLAAILHNLKAPFSGGTGVIAGADLTYVPIDIAKQSNQYRDAKGWFDKTFTFADLPTGKQKFANVDYNVYEFATSPVPTVIMLGGPKKLPNEVKGIPVNLKADALFFLQTARIDRPLSRDERVKNSKIELFHYVIHYADGSSQTVPIYTEIDADNFKQEAPKALPGAQIAWTAPFEGGKFSAVAYAKQWNNPRPDIAIQSIDMAYGDPSRGVPVLLAVTAATAHH